MENLKNLKKRIQNIESRNNRVETDKAWELSYTRRGVIALFTYIAIGFYLQTINIEGAWLHAIVPTVAFMLSTLTLPFFKKIWFNYIYKKS